MKKRNTLLDGTARTADRLHYTVHAVSPSFRRMEIEPVFAGLAPFLHAPGAPSVHVLVTFQAVDVWAPAPAPDAAAEKEDRGTAGEGGAKEPACTLPGAAPGSSCCGGGGPSLIDYSDGAAEFKDHSREAFWEWVARLRDVLAKRLRRDEDVLPTASEPLKEEVGGAAESVPAARSLWIDWVDPATGLAASGECGPCAWNEADGVEQLVVGAELVHVGTAGGGCRMIVHPRLGENVYPATAVVACDTDVLLAALRDDM